jgi:FkbM family methyltransferase
MSFISYAQNFEDVMLWRALKHVKKGFYIDIGAQDPIVDSVSLAFYEHGWRGVHVEPTQQYSSKLKQARPDEIVEQLAIGDSSKNPLIFFEFSDTGLSTGSPEVAKRHEQAGYKSIHTEVPVISLDVLMEKYGNRDVNWLKLDVEGLEASVLQSWRIAALRPWVLVIESTRPLTQEQSYAEWESMVIEKGYSFVYFDGLNRFYVHEDHSELLSAFASPPSIFDGFVLSGTASQPFCQLVAEKGRQSRVQAELAEAKAQQASERAALAEAKAQQASERAALAETQAKQAGERAVNAVSALTAVHHSSSWRLTAPLRRASRAVSAFSQGQKDLKPAIKTKTKLLLAHASLYVNRRPKLRQAALVVLAKFPALKARLKVATMNRYFEQTTKPTDSNDLANLTPRARQIYADLKDSIDRRKRECN